MNAEEKKIGLRVEGLDGTRTLPVCGDEGKLRQVLINLLGNAVKFTERGRIVLTVAPGEGRSWTFSVSDTGPGIATEAQRAIFEPFQQGPGGRAVGLGRRATGAAAVQRRRGGRREQAGTDRLGAAQPRRDLPRGDGVSRGGT